VSELLTQALTATGITRGGDVSGNEEEGNEESCQEEEVRFAVRERWGGISPQQHL